MLQSWDRKRGQRKEREISAAKNRKGGRGREKKDVNREMWAHSVGDEIFRREKKSGKGRKGKSTIKIAADRNTTTRDS